MKRQLIIDDLPEYYDNHIIFATYKLWSINNNGTLNDIGIVGRQELLDYDEKEKGGSVYGYDLNEIITLAAACREAKITDKQLHDFITNLDATAAWCREVYFNEMIRISDEAVKDVLKTVRNEDSENGYREKEKEIEEEWKKLHERLK